MSDQMFVLGITGGIGSGKSEVLRCLATMHGATICRADEVGRQLQKKGGAAYDPIVETFGEEILRPDGELDRPKLASIVFNDPAQLKVLNEIVHPLVLKEVLDFIWASSRGGSRIFALESAILLDVAYQDFCDEVWYVHTPMELRIDRIARTRNMTEEQVKSVIARQMSEREFRRYCDYTIENTGDLNDLRVSVESRLKVLGL